MIERLKKSKAGFTLVELIVVIAILGILAGISVPVYSGYIAKANEAADLQLLGALNTAFSAARAELGLWSTDIVAAATLSGEKGSKSLSGITTVGDGVSNLSYGSKSGSDALYDAFLFYYGDNIEKEFKSYSSLGWDSKNGVFVDGSKPISVPYGGGTVTVTMGQLAAYQVSTFGDMTTSKVLGEVDNVVDAASYALGSMADNSNLNATLREFMKTQLNFTDEELAALKLDMVEQEDGKMVVADTPENKAKEQILANAMVLMVASKAKDLDTASIISQYKTNGSVDLMSMLKGSEDAENNGSFAADAATALTIPYALAMAYVNSDQVKNDIADSKTEIDVYRNIATGEEISEKEYDALLEAAGNKNARRAIAAQYEQTTTYKYTYGDTSDLFYNGGTILDSTGYQTEITGTGENMKSYEDASAVIQAITQSDGFKAYMVSGQGEADLQGFVSAMTMLDSNAGNIDRDNLLTNGFGDAELQAMVASILGK